MDIVNDKYWLGFAKTQIDESNTTVNEASAKLTNLITVFWGIYVAAFSIGSITSDLDESLLVIVLLILPIPLLILAHWSSVRAGLPIFMRIDPRIPKEVKNHFRVSMRKKKIRLLIASSITFVSALSIAVALVQSNFLNKKSKQSTRIVLSRSDTAAYIIVSSQIPNESIVQITIDSLTEERKYVNIETINDLVHDLNAYNHQYKLLWIPSNLKVTLSWKTTDNQDVWSSFTKVLKE